MELFLQLHQKYIDGPPTLTNIVLFSLFDKFPTSDPRVVQLINKKEEFIIIAIQLYMSIYGLTNREMYRRLLTAPQQNENHIKNVVFILLLYQTSSMYCHQIKGILGVIYVVSRSTEFYDQIDLQPITECDTDIDYFALSLRDRTCQDHPMFEPFIRAHVDPFVLHMRNLKNFHKAFLEEDPMTADEKYRSTYTQVHLDHVNKLVYETSQFLRNIDKFKQVLLNDRSHYV